MADMFDEAISLNNDSNVDTSTMSGDSDHSSSDSEDFGSDHTVFSDDDEEKIWTDNSTTDEASWSSDFTEEDKDDASNVGDASHANWTSWGSAHFQVVQTYNDDWDPEKVALDNQAYSGSLIAKRLAEMQILIDLEHGAVLAGIEKKMETRILSRKQKALQRRRRERTVLVNTSESLSSLLDRLQKLDHAWPRVVVDCEGLNFKMTGTIDIMELFVMPQDTLYLIDVVALGDKAWSIKASDSDFCLREFLTSKTYQKIMWDLRMDAHILNRLYTMKLAGVIDASLWDVAYRRTENPSDQPYRRGIVAACRFVLRYDMEVSEIKSLERAKSERSKLPPRPWAIRPLPRVLIDYAGDVKYMGWLYFSIRHSLRKRSNLIKQIEYYTEQDLEIASNPYYDATGEQEPLSPWSSGYIADAWHILELNRQDAINGSPVETWKRLKSEEPPYTGSS